MIEYVLKKPYVCAFGTLNQGGSIRVMSYNGKDVVFYDGGMVNGDYGEILLNLIETPSLHQEYLYDREVINNKV